MNEVSSFTLVIKLLSQHGFKHQKNNINEHHVVRQKEESEKYNKALILQKFPSFLLLTWLHLPPKNVPKSSKNQSLYSVFQVFKVVHFEGVHPHLIWKEMGLKWPFRKAMSPIVVFPWNAFYGRTIRFNKDVQPWSYHRMHSAVGCELLSLSLLTFQLLYFHLVDL